MNNLKITNPLFENAINHIPQKVPPIWMMRQAGRYHSHYQNLRSKHSFDTLCREPELAAQVALGPIQDFDFDVSILFSDLLYPLDAMGFGLSYSDSGPKLERNLNKSFCPDSSCLDSGIEKMLFQAKALSCTRHLLPKDKSLIGFVGGPWTLFVYAVEGGHSGNHILSKQSFFNFPNFYLLLESFLKKNIQLQLDAGAEIVMIFDTAAGEVSSEFFKNYLSDTLIQLSKSFPGKLGYYSKGTQDSYFDDNFKKAPWAGQGYDHRNFLPNELRKSNKGFTQGNFDQALLHLDDSNFDKELRLFLKPFSEMSLEDRAGWVCGLGHGILPKTPEKNVRKFVDFIRSELEKS